MRSADRPTCRSSLAPSEAIPRPVGVRSVRFEVNYPSPDSAKKTEASMMVLTTSRSSVVRGA